MVPSIAIVVAGLLTTVSTTAIAARSSVPQAAAGVASGQARTQLQQHQQKGIEGRSDVDADAPDEARSDIGSPSQSGQHALPSEAVEEPQPEDKAEIIVTGERPRGSVAAEIPPELTFRQLDIRAYGANNIQELLQTLAPQVRSNRGRQDNGPVVLVNGKRVSSQAEIDRIPTEAIERMEVFPEELSLRYGFRADQKVVNVVLFSRFDSRLGQASYTAPTEGGRDTPGLLGTYLRTRGDTRFNFDADYSRSGALLESDRDVRQVFGSDGLGRYRTLLPETERIVLTGTVAGQVVNDVASSLNARFEDSRSESLFGLGAAGPLGGDTDTRNTHLGTTFNGQFGRWLWNFTGNYDRTNVATSTDAVEPSTTRNRARSVNSVADAAFVLSGPALNLPAGPVSTSLRTGFDTRDFTSSSVVDGSSQSLELYRDRATVQANLDIPIAGQRATGLRWLGDLSVYANLEFERLSDFGTLRKFGYGLNWSPTAAVNITGTVTDEEGAPTVEQLGSPTIVTPNIRTFDFARGETVDVTRVFAGNPRLRSDARLVRSIGIYVKPFARTDITLSIDYLSTRIDDPIAAFPIALPEIERAFPQRFSRDLEGQLTRIDSAPLNFARSDQEQVRWGVNFTRPLGAIPEALRNTRVRFARNEAEAKSALPPGARLTRLEPGSPAARQAENITSRFFVSFYHTVRLEDEILLIEDGPVLDLLDGGAIDFRGGRPRHELEVQAGVFKRGLGARVSANWQSETSVSGQDARLDGTVSDLTFSSLTTVNVNVFANLADLFGGPNAPDWLKRTRLTFSVANLFNERQDVRDAGGATPINYQPAYLNPLGRLVSVSLRKVF